MNEQQARWLESYVLDEDETLDKWTFLEIVAGRIRFDLGSIAADEKAIKKAQGKIVDPGDGEVLRLSEQGTVIQWDADIESEYDCGETLQEWGIHNLTEEEAKRVGISLEQLRTARKSDERSASRIADHVDGYDRDDLGESPD